MLINKINKSVCMYNISINNICFVLLPLLSTDNQILIYSILQFKQTLWKDTSNRLTLPSIQTPYQHYLHFIVLSSVFWLCFDFFSLLIFTLTFHFQCTFLVFPLSYTRLAMICKKNSFSFYRKRVSWAEITLYVVKYFLFPRN